MAICRSCGSEYADARSALGYKICLLCGEDKAKQVKHCVVPLNKSNYVYVSMDSTDTLKQLNPKRTT